MRILRKFISKLVNPMDYKMVIVVRNDLGMGKGKIAAQVGHAAVLCAIESYKQKEASLLIDSDYDRWMQEGCQKKVVVKVNTLDELNVIEAHAKNAGQVHAKITDFGLTQIEPNTVTVLGIGPAPAEKLDPIVGHLKLL